MWHWRRSNDAENTAHHRNKLHFKEYSNKTVILNCNNISQKLVFCIFYQINAALMNIRNFFKNLTDLKLLMASEYS